MKMAKASEADLKMALDLSVMLEGFERGHFPVHADGDLADGLPGRWWRMPSGLVFKMDRGFNNVMCMDIPAFRAKGRGPWYGIRPSTVRRSKYRAFLERCECLGDTVPTDLIRAQVRRLEALGRWQPVPMLRGDSYGDETETQDDPACQLELFA
jgi:hypothetical protein